MPNHPAQAPNCVYWSDGDDLTPVFQRPAEFDALLALYAERRPRRVLEVGTYYGGTLKQWIGRGAPGLRVVAVDHFHAYYDPRPRAQVWADAAGAELHCLAGSSHDPATIAAAQALGLYDWIYIDADHVYRAAHADWLAYGPMCAPGGVVVLHDIVADPRHHPEIEVPRLWAEIKAEHRTTEYVESYSAPWGGLGVVHL
jgi:predicted O-methyltransferase YrrM